MFLDITGMVRDRRMRALLPQMVGIYGPGVAHAVDRLLTDPRLAAGQGEQSITRQLSGLSSRWRPDCSWAWCGL